MQDVVIVAATRTAIGSFQGSLANIPAPELGAAVIRQLLAQTGLAGEQVDEVILGQVLTAGSGQNPARQAAILAGLPNSVGGITVNRFCASGLSAVAMAADRIRVGEADVMIAAGTESMSMVPMMGNSPSLSPAIFANTQDVEQYGIAYGMGLTAEKVAQQWKVSREASGAQLFQVIHVSPAQIRYEARLATGELYDAFTLAKGEVGKSVMTEQVPATDEIDTIPVEEDD